MNNEKIQPIIIVGAGRSGTKFLRDTLLFSKDTCAIPYDVNYIWRTGSENHPNDELPIDLLSDKKIQIIRNTFFKMSGATNSNSQFMLEKTVGNALRVPFVRKIFPEAKFIHLVRDGRAVTESAMRLWEDPPESGYLLKKLRYFPLKNYQYAFSYAFNMLSGLLFAGRGQKTWGPLYEGIFQDIEANKPLISICAKQWKTCVDKATNDLSLINSKDVYTVRYEDLMASDALKDLCEFIGLSDTDLVMKNFLKKKQPNNSNIWKKSLSNEQITFLNEHLNSTLNLHQYN